ncbi:MAG: tRNA (guanosine(46)-N7)-methyltransferase TrmB [Clostridia bacterium]|nr:tRNA (guanosine(46)-N7)-methyltransferase TrmB [Clostridia bacterium]
MRVRYNKNAEKILNENSICINNPLNLKGKWKKEFANNNPIYLEIGMGKGNFIINMAKAFPNVNFIGLERNRTILVKALKKIQEENIANIRIISNDAQKLLDIFKKGELDKIFLNFSDPWPKNKHFKRRLTYRSFLDLYDIILKKDSVIEFKTDNQILFEFTIMEICNTRHDMKSISLDLHKTDEFNIMTEYEEKFSKKGNRIYKLVWLKK